MANNTKASLYIAGQSGNPLGRPKSSVQTPAGKIERFYLGYFTPTYMRRLLKSIEKTNPDRVLDHAERMAPFFMTRKVAEGITTEERAQWENMLKEAINAKKNESKAV